MAREKAESELAEAAAFISQLESRLQVGGARYVSFTCPKAYPKASKAPVASVAFTCFCRALRKGISGGMGTLRWARRRGSCGGGWVCYSSVARVAFRSRAGAFAGAAGAGGGEGGRAAGARARRRGAGGGGGGGPGGS
eukprot:1186149-Prorocentrum_minimum.AAC.7